MVCRVIMPAELTSTSMPPACCAISAASRAKASPSATSRACPVATAANFGRHPLGRLRRRDRSPRPALRPVAKPRLLAAPIAIAAASDENDLAGEIKRHGCAPLFDHAGKVYPLTSGHFESASVPKALSPAPSPAICNSPTVRATRPAS